MGEEVQIYRRKGEKSMEWDRGGGGEGEGGGGGTSLLQIRISYSRTKMTTGWLKQSTVMPHIQHADCQPCQKSLI